MLRKQHHSVPFCMRHTYVMPRRRWRNVQNIAHGRAEKLNSLIPGGQLKELFQHPTLQHFVRDISKLWRTCALLRYASAASCTDTRGGYLHTNLTVPHGGGAASLQASHSITSAFYWQSWSWWLVHLWCAVLFYRFLPIISINLNASNKPSFSKPLYCCLLVFAP